MSVANVVKRLQGVFFNEESTASVDLQTLVTDFTKDIPMILDAAAGTDYVYGSWKVPFNCQIVDATVCPGAALTAADATANTYTLAKADGAGGAATTCATLVTNLAGGSWVADTFKSMTLGTAAACTLAAGQIVTLKKTHASTGTVTPASTLTLKIRKV